MFLEDTFLEEFIHNLIVFYDENSTRDNVYTITTRKLLLPHVHSFLQLAESTNNEVTVHKNCIAIMLYLHLYISWVDICSIRIRSIHFCALLLL